jgi:4-amino-4-deoxy-L-arabinose transferase-like glycosyltransferase
MRTILNFLNKYWILVLIIAGGTGVRLYNLTKISLWHDEAFSALLIKYSWGEMFYRIGLDVHPPLYYVFLRIWHYIFGHSVFSMRAMSVAFGVGTIIISYAFVKRFLGGTRAALIVATLIAVNPFQVQYVTEARMYTMGAFLAVLAAYLLGLALQATKNYYITGSGLKPSRLKLFFYYLGFTLVGSALMYTHYYLLFTVAALGVYGIIYLWITFRWNITRYVWLILSAVGMGLLYIPWLNWFIYQYKQVGAGYWIPPINIWSIPDTLYRLTFNIGAPSKIVMTLTTMFVIWFVWGFLKKIHQTEKWLILGTFLAPFGGALLFLAVAQLQGSDSSVYMVRYFIFSAPFLMIMLGLWIARIQISTLKTLALLVIIGSFIFSIGYYWKEIDINNRPGMAAIAKYLNANVEPEHKIYVGSNFEFFNYKYYNTYVYKQTNRPYLYTHGSLTKDMPHFAGTAILTDEELVLDFAKSTQAGDTVWLIWTNAFGGSKPLVPNNWTQIDERGEADVRPYVGTWIVVTQYKVN